VLVLRWFLDATRVAQLVTDNGISVSTAYRYLHEGIDVLAAVAPGLHGALLAAKLAGHTHVLLDGTLIRTDRSTAVGPESRAYRQRHRITTTATVGPQIAQLRDNRPAAEQGANGCPEGDLQSWLEISEVGFRDGTVVEVLHGSPDLVAAAAWAGTRMADLDARDGDTDHDHQVAQVAALHNRLAAARNDAVSRLAEEDNARGEDHSTARRGSQRTMRPRARPPQ
jgi:hypothetical protein